MLQVSHQPEEGPGMRPAQLDHPHARRNLGEELACRHPEQEIHPMSLRHEVLRHVHGDAFDTAALEGVGENRQQRLIGHRISHSIHAFHCHAGGALPDRFRLMPNLPATSDGVALAC